MSRFTILNTPKIKITNESFVYNFYVDNETNIIDEKFMLYENESRLFALNTIDANNLVKPRFISFNLDLRDKNSYNRESINRMRRRDRALTNTIINNRAANRYLSLLEGLGSSQDNLFNAANRIRHFNDIHSLKYGQVHDRSFDLTISEDMSDLYRQMVKFFDEEDPNEVIDANSNRSYIDFTNKNLYQTDNVYSPEGAIKHHVKNGTFSVTLGSLFDRLRNANRKNEWTFLEDKQEESAYNYRTYYREGQDAARQRGNLEAHALNAEDSFEAEERRSRFSIDNLFDENPDIMVQTADEADLNELNEYIVGVLIDKFEINNSVYGDRQYKCSKFIKLAGNALETFTIIDEAVNYGKSYIYETRPVLMQSYAGQANGPVRNFYLILGNRISSYGIKCVERESPEPPAYLELNYDLNKKGIRLKWCLPKNRQRDIANFQVFRRESPFEPFTLIKEIRRRNIQSLDGTLENFESVSEDIIENYDYFKCSYVDNSIQNNKTYIYAVCCIDMHGLSSAYSAQVAGKFNSLTSRLDVDTISLAGALKQYPNQFFPRKTKFFNFENDVISNTPIIKNKSKMNIYLTPDYQRIVNEHRPTQVININRNVDEVENYFSISLTNINTLKTANQNIYIQDREE